MVYTTWRVGRRLGTLKALEAKTNSTAVALSFGKKRGKHTETTTNYYFFLRIHIIHYAEAARNSCTQRSRYFVSESMICLQCIHAKTTDQKSM